MATPLGTVAGRRKGTSRATADPVSSMIRPRSPSSGQSSHCESPLCLHLCVSLALSASLCPYPSLFLSQREIPVRPRVQRCVPPLLGRGVRGRGSHCTGLPPPHCAMAPRRCSPRLRGNGGAARARDAYTIVHGRSGADAGPSAVPSSESHEAGNSFVSANSTKPTRQGV